MPLNPLENMPEALRRMSVGIDKFCNSFMDIKLEGQLEEWEIGNSTKPSPSETSKIADKSSPNYLMNTLTKHPKGDTIDAIIQVKAAVNEAIVVAQQTVYNQPCTLAQVQAREADIKALADLALALDKKKAVLIELRHMNEKASRTKKDSAPVTDSENFRKQYLMVVAQQKEVCKQVESALLCVRQRNTYPENSTPPWHTPRSSGAATHQGSLSPALHSQDSSSSIIEIVQSSRQKARSMVDIAVQATDDLRGEEAFVRIGEALDLKNTNSKLRYIPPDLAHEKSGYEYCTCRIEVTSSHIHSPKCNNANDGNRVQFPIEMISNCVATLFMIQLKLDVLLHGCLLGFCRHDVYMILGELCREPISTS